MPKQFATISDHDRLANARVYLEATVEELARVKGFEQTIVEAANARTILHSILGKLELLAKLRFDRVLYTCAKPPSTNNSVPVT